MAVDLDFFVQLYSVWLVLIPGFTRLMTNLRRLGGFIQVILCDTTMYSACCNPNSILQI